MNKLDGLKKELNDLNTTMNRKRKEMIEMMNQQMANLNKLKQDEPVFYKIFQDSGGLSLVKKMDKEMRKTLNKPAEHLGSRDMKLIQKQSEVHKAKLNTVAEQLIRAEATRLVSERLNQSTPNTPKK